MIRTPQTHEAQIERALLAHEAVTECVVLSRVAKGGGRRLVAYVVANRPVPAEELDSRLTRLVPEDYLPAAYAQISALPLTAEGSVDRDHLESLCVLDSDLLRA